MRLSEDLELAHRLADEATAVALAHFGGPVAQRNKPDGSLVSEADLATEEVLLRIIARERPGDSILAEESGSHPGSAARHWILDPIDGTSEFLAGENDWGPTSRWRSMVCCGWPCSPGRPSSACGGPSGTGARSPALTRTQPAPRED